ncbi:MAG: hypothetical protein II814_04760, partial [Treponema sp.]|nr:hypothetical protein [Treponema sp.]
VRHAGRPPGIVHDDYFLLSGILQEVAEARKEIMFKKNCPMFAGQFFLQLVLLQQLDAGGLKD